MKVFIINRDRLTTTRRMAEYLLYKVDDAEPVIFDNASTYPPLLGWYSGEWYHGHQCPVPVIRSPLNGGPQGAWNDPLFKKEIPLDGKFYAVTDSDLDLTGCPSDLLEVLSAGLHQYPELCKCGLSLRTDDIPDGFPDAERVRYHEFQFQTEELDDLFYKADIETTFAVYRSWPCLYGPAARAKPPYQAKHVPWYITPETITDEERYYIQHIPVEFQGPVWSKIARDYSFTQENHDDKAVHQLPMPDVAPP